MTDTNPAQFVCLWLLLGLSMAWLIGTRSPSWRQRSAQRWLRSELPGQQVTGAQQHQLEVELTVRSRAWAMGGMVGAVLGAIPLLFTKPDLTARIFYLILLPAPCWAVSAALSRSVVALVRASRAPNQPGVRVAMSSRVRSSMFLSWASVVLLVMAVGLSLAAGTVTLALVLPYDGGFSVSSSLVLGVMIGLGFTTVVSVGLALRLVRAPLRAGDAVGLQLAQSLRREETGGLVAMILTQVTSLISMISGADVSNVPWEVRRVALDTPFLLNVTAIIAAAVGICSWAAYVTKSRPHPPPAPSPAWTP